MTLYASKQSAFAAALSASQSPATRGKSTVLLKDSLKRDLTGYSRLLVRTVQGVSTLTNQQKSDLGVTVRTIPGSIPAPGTAPQIDFIAVSGRKVKIRLHDSASGSKRGRPPAVKGVSIFSHVGPAAPGTIADWTFEGNTSKTLMGVQFPDTVPAGSLIWLTAFWYNAKSQAGPMTAPVSTNIAGGGVSMAA